MLATYVTSAHRLVWAALITVAASGCVDLGEPPADVPPSCDLILGAAQDSLEHSPEAPDGCHWRVTPGEEAQGALQSAIVLAGTGETICLAAGTYALRYEVQIDTHGLTLRGAGASETVLDFSSQVLGRSGLSVWSGNVTIEELTVRDTAGDGVRATGVDNAAFRKVAVTWTSEAAGEAAARGLLARDCNGLVIDGCVVSGASGAGIVVSESFRARITGSHTSGNSAGIMVENSQLVEVVDNHVDANGVGIVVADLPRLKTWDGARVKVSANTVEKNNAESLVRPKSILGSVPSGTGVLLLGVDRCEVTGNTIQDNRSVGVMIQSWDSAVYGATKDPKYDPYPQSNWVHDNTLEHNGFDPLGAYGATGDLPSLVWDGCADAGTEDPKGALRNCWSANGAAGYQNLDRCGTLTDPPTEIAAVTCELETLNLPEPCSSRAGCNETAPAAPAPQDGGECTIPFPRLSDYGFFGGRMADLEPEGRVFPYDMTAPLWTDGAVKRRFISLPEEAVIGFREADMWLFPSGTILIMNVGYPVDATDPAGALTLIETRLMVHSHSGWAPHTYLWNADQTEAHLRVGGDVGAFGDERPYRVANPNGCARCHKNSGTIVPLGPKTRQLNRAVVRGDQTVDQLEWLSQQGVFAFPLPPAASLPLQPEPHGAGSLEDRARSWLDAVCGHCHRPGGAAEASGLSLSAPEKDLLARGVCKPVATHGPVPGGHAYDIVPGAPDDSYLVYLLGSTDPAIRMPPLPSLTVDPDGLKLVRDWIAAMPAEACE